MSMSVDYTDLSKNSTYKTEKIIKNINDTTIRLTNSLRGIGGVDENLINKIEEIVSQCLQTRKESEQKNAAEKIRNTEDIPTAQQTELKEEYHEEIEYKIPEEIEQYCKNFKEKIEWISDVNIMVNRLKDFLKQQHLTIKNDNTGNKIILNNNLSNNLGYDIKILNLWNYNNNKKYNYNITTKDNEITPAKNHFETDRNSMLKIPIHRSEWRKIPTQRDIKNILKNITWHYRYKGGVNWNNHDENIAFFMLIIQSEWKFLLKKDNLFEKNMIFECSKNFRWFKEMLKSSTGQIMLVRKKTN